MIHIGKNTTSTIVSKGISARTGRPRIGRSQNSEERNRRALFRSAIAAAGRPVRRAHVPYLEVKNTSSHWSTRLGPRRSARTRFLLPAAWDLGEDAVSMIVHGFCKEVFRELPMEFAGGAEAARREFRRSVG